MLFFFIVIIRKKEVLQKALVDFYVLTVCIWSENVRYRDENEKKTTPSKPTVNPLSKLFFQTIINHGK